MPPTHHPTKKALIITAIGISIVGGLIAWGFHSSKQPIPATGSNTPTPTVSWPSVAVKKIEVSDNSKTQDISAEYPQTSSDAITTLFKQFVDDQIATFKTDTAGMPADFRAVTLDITYDEQQNTRADNYVFHIYSDTGGAHGIEVTATFSFGVTGKQIKLADLFLNETKGLQLVSDAVKVELLKHPNADSQWISDGAAPTEENYKNFTIAENGVTFLFDPYQVAPYSDGQQTVTVPVTAFQSQANPSVFH